MAQAFPDAPNGNPQWSRPQLLLWLLQDTGETTQHKAEKYAEIEENEVLLFLGLHRRVQMMSELLDKIASDQETLLNFDPIERHYLVKLSLRLEPFKRLLEMEERNEREQREHTLTHGELRERAKRISELMKKMAQNFGSDRRDK